MENINSAWVRNGLRYEAGCYRAKERACRKRFKSDAMAYMRGQSDYISDAYAEAAAVFERRLEELDKLVTEGGDGR